MIPKPEKISPRRNSIYLSRTNKDPYKPPTSPLRRKELRVSIARTVDLSINRYNVYLSLIDRPLSVALLRSRRDLSTIDRWAMLIKQGRGMFWCLEVSMLCKVCEKPEHPRLREFCSLYCRRLFQVRSDAQDRRDREARKRADGLSTKERQKQRAYEYRVRQRELRLEAIQRMLDSQGGECYICGKILDLSLRGSFQKDHMVPLSRNGPDTPDNWGITCTTCNLRKGDWTPEELVQWARRVVSKADREGSF